MKSEHPASQTMKNQRGVVTSDSQLPLADLLKITNSLPEAKAPPAFVQTDGDTTIAMKKPASPLED